MISLRVAVAALLATLTPAVPLAQESVLDRPIEKEGWPVEVTRRPLTLAAGLLEVSVPLGIGVSRYRSGKPIFLTPSVYYGVSDTFTIGLRHFQGLCLSGGPDCPKIYADVSVDSLWRVWRGASTDVALGLALNASPVTDPLALSAEARVVARLRGGPVSLTLAPAFEVGLTNRDAAVARTEPLAFPLATGTFGFFQTAPGNREMLRVPATLAVQATPNFALAVAISLDGPLDPPAGSYSDFYSIPVGGALVLSPRDDVDLGASFTFLNLLGRQTGVLDRTDLRGMQVFVTVRL
ncbi:MAG TPA: hypothetical protein VF805_12530 [Anaeromyxobacteraceae bacterium]